MKESSTCQVPQVVHHAPEFYLHLAQNFITPVVVTFRKKTCIAFMIEKKVLET
jgi:hypothetical protein